MGFWVDRERALELSAVIRGLKGLIREFERSDPQYIAAAEIGRVLGCSKASVVIVANALVSYQLTSTGEEYWSSFAEWVKSRGSGVGPREINESFLRATPLNAIGRRQKLERVRRFYESPLPEELERSFEQHCSNLRAFAKRVSEAIGARPDSKTVVFAAKMLRYLCLACGLEPGGGLPMPIDRRNATALLLSCVVKGCEGAVEQCAKDLVTRHRRVALEAWEEVCRAAEVDCLELDALVWRVTGLLLGRGGGAKAPGLPAGVEPAAKALAMELAKCAGGTARGRIEREGPPRF